MNAPVHHLDDDLLLDYVTGAAPEPVALLAACHLTLCATCRAAAAAAESVGGALLAQAAPSPLSDGALERLLGRLDDGGPQAEGRSPGVFTGVGEPFVFAGVPLPRPLAGYLTPGAAPSAAVARLRFIAPGIRGVDLPTASSPTVRTRLLRLSAGLEIPRDLAVIQPARQSLHSRVTAAWPMTRPGSSTDSATQ